ncbi:hypothetical protein Leryth_020839 [Lithospermum erythrorhizon]|nr:hypothetical protein Leryth_020839 [Lithospermum erythrorhizon]
MWVSSSFRNVIGFNFSLFASRCASFSKPVKLPERLVLYWEEGALDVCKLQWSIKFMFIYVSCYTVDNANI